MCALDDLLYWIRNVVEVNVGASVHEPDFFLPIVILLQFFFLHARFSRFQVALFAGSSLIVGTVEPALSI